MSLEVEISIEDPAELKKIIASLTDDQQRYKERIKYLEEHIRLLKNEIFGRKRDFRSKNRKTVCPGSQPN
jgi:hypothetical protein